MLITTNSNLEYLLCWKLYTYNYGGVVVYCNQQQEAQLLL